MNRIDRELRVVYFNGVGYVVRQTGHTIFIGARYGKGFFVTYYVR